MTDLEAGSDPLRFEIEVSDVEAHARRTKEGLEEIITEGNIERILPGILAKISFSPKDRESIKIQLRRLLTGYKLSVIQSIISSFHGEGKPGIRYLQSSLRDIQK